MPDITKELIVYLKTVTVITDIIGIGAAARIYEELAKQNIPARFIVLETFEGNSYKCLTQRAGIDQNRIQVDCYGQTADDAFELDQAVYSTLDMFLSGSMGSAFVNQSMAESSFRKGFDNAISGGNQKRYWVSRDYEISYSVPTGV